MNNHQHYKIIGNGDSSISILFNEVASYSLACKIAHLNQQLHIQLKNYVTDFIPSYQSITLNFEPSTIQFFDLQSLLEQFLSKWRWNDDNFNFSNKAQVIEIPVCYEKEFAPDLAYVAKHCGLTQQQVINTHSEAKYWVYMLGFQPGFLYLNGLNQALHCPRKPMPNTQIETGSVGIGGSQTGVYSLASPGGWQIIGQTPISLFNINKASPTIAKPLDEIQFKPIDQETFYQLKSEQN